MKRITNLPDEICFPPGVIGETAKHVLRRSQHKHAEFGLSAGLALVSVLVGRKVVDETGTTPNLYVLNLGPTGSGKETPRRVLKELLAGTQLLASERFTSDSAFINELMAKPSMLAVSDEIGDLIEELSDGRASTHVKNLATAMTEAYTQAGSVWNYKGFADVTKSKSVSLPNFVLHGSGNASKLFRSLRPERISSGFVGRFTMFLSSNGGGRCDRLSSPAVDPINPRPNEYSSTVPPAGEILEFITAWTKEPESRVGEIFRPSTLTIHRSREARERLQDHFENIHSRLSDDTGTIAEELWARASEKTAKFALLSAVSRGSNSIELSDANWAIQLSNALTRRLVALCTRHVAESSWDAKALEILRRIQDHGTPIEHSELLKASRIKSKEFLEIIMWLMEAGEIVTAQKPTGGRQLTGYATSEAVFSKRDGKRNEWVILTKEVYEQVRKGGRT